MKQLQNLHVLLIFGKSRIPCACQAKQHRNVQKWRGHVLFLNCLSHSFKSHAAELNTSDVRRAALKKSKATNTKLAAPQEKEGPSPQDMDHGPDPQRLAETPLPCRRFPCGLALTANPILDARWKPWKQVCSARRMPSTPALTQQDRSKMHWRQPVSTARSTPRVAPTAA